MPAGMRLWILAAAAATTLLASGCALSGGGEYTSHLVRYDDHLGEQNRFVNLEDGAAQLAIGSPDGHRIVVQWRDPDGSGWTEPETVWTDPDNLAVENTVRYGGGTVAILQLFTTDVHSEDDTDSITVAIVCRDLRCTASGAPGFGGEAQVTPDGRTAYLGQDEKGVTWWTTGAGIHKTPWSGHPGFAYHSVSPSEPVLAPDGSLRVVTSRPARGSCTFDLLASAPAGSALHRVARTTARVRGHATSDCRSYLDTFSADWVTVHPDDHRAATFWFVREGDAWVTTDEDPSGLRLVDVDRGCCDTAISGFVHWNDVAYASPDGRRIQVQTHLLGEPRWTDPQLLGGAPASSTCTWTDGHEVGAHGFVVLLVCHSGKVRDEYVGDSYLIAASPDLRTWQSRFVTGVRTAPVVDRDHVRVGDTTWSPEHGFGG